MSKIIRISPLLLLLVFVAVHESDGLASRCWQFTWPGQYNLNTLNGTAKCNPADIGTEENSGGGGSEGDGGSDGSKSGSGRAEDDDTTIIVNGTEPDIDAMKNMLLSGTLTDDTNCALVTGQMCISWTHYDTSGSKTAMTKFCGRAQQTNPTTQALGPGCHTQNVGTFTREVCICDDSDFCNNSPDTRPLFVVFTSSLILVLSRLLCFS
ncbi:unnamed protein product [Darwinula stevensoni]|uniref:Protein quiver n=1 Tax=Darwinula stevensoni TaxID=69355 RepID=A0A7R8ZXW2_9CRUS|nr:unnamed protein product [Darwinula stevensoni]CAG0880238.1 unnamed protein product [Darwinula stevensoni]